MQRMHLVFVLLAAQAVLPTSACAAGLRPPEKARHNVACIQAKLHLMKPLLDSLHCWQSGGQAGRQVVVKAGMHNSQVKCRTPKSGRLMT